MTTSSTRRWPIPIRGADSPRSSRRGDRGFTAAFLTEFPDAVDMDSRRAQVERGFAKLTRRAQECGRLRRDFDPSDLMLLLPANCAIATEDTETALAGSRRLIAYLIQSFQADPAPPLPPPAAITPVPRGLTNARF
ncbi:hypothetical protein [Amycolatopsis sp. NPDC051128]|uniref:SbtR family transcriptional regulator n=1 Tax=Amycolatopsis sp. NPDC051128 TaxID=3155412 RepID=UPI003412016C